MLVSSFYEYEIVMNKLLFWISYCYKDVIVMFIKLRWFVFKFKFKYVEI